MDSQISQASPAKMRYALYQQCSVTQCWVKVNTAPHNPSGYEELREQADRMRPMGSVVPEVAQ